MPGDNAESGDRISAAMRQAIDDQQHQRWDEAARKYREVLKLDPANADCLNLFGVLCHQTGRTTAGIKKIRQAIKLSPKTALFHFNLAEVYRAQGKYKDAIASYQRGVDFGGQSTNLYYGLGNAHYCLNHIERAAQCFEAGLQYSPDDAELHNNLANAYDLLGRTDKAIEHYKRATECDDSYAESHVNLAELLIRNGQIESAIDRLKHVTDIAPRYARGWEVLGRQYQNEREYSAAIQCYQQMLGCDPASVDVLNRLAECHIAQDHFTEASACLSGALELRDNATSHYLSGVCRERQGAFEEAIREHRRAIALDKTAVTAHAHLSSIRQYTPDAQHLRSLEKLAHSKQLSNAQRVHVYFSLARFADAAGDVDRAFDCFVTANQLQRELTPFDRARHLHYFDRLMAHFDDGFFAARRDHGHPLVTPVFIVGMPRSGSTLVEQMLASHSRVVTVGESYAVPGMLRQLSARLDGDAGYPENTAQINRLLSNELAEECLGRYKTIDYVKSQLVDKMLGNYARLGMIALLFPRARIIHCKRNPIATCFSCYTQHFESGYRFSYDLDDLVVAYKSYQALMAHWKNVLPVNILEVEYEALIDRQEAESRNIVEFCNLPWEDACLNYHSNDRIVQTASFWQVKQPIYRTSLERWKLYSEHIRPLIDAFTGDSNV